MVVIKLDKFIERELKILISESDFYKIIQSYDFTNPIIQTNTYYDTEDQQIKKQNGAMRIRQIDNKKIFTIKIRKDEVTHYEYEKEILTNNIQEINDEEINSWLKKFNIPKNVHKIVTFTTERRTCDFKNGQLCIDKTSYENHIDYEIEYEYFNEHDGIEALNKILEPIQIKYTKNCPSKIARATKIYE